MRRLATQRLRSATAYVHGLADATRTEIARTMSFYSIKFEYVFGEYRQEVC
jgi:hypothetical protein